MKASPFTFSEAFTDLKYFRVSGREEPLHTQLRGRLKERRACAKGIKVRFGGGGGNELRGLNLQVAAVDKKPPDGMDHPGPQPEMRSPAGQSALFFAAVAIL